MTRPHAVSCIVPIEGKILFVRHTYGVAKGRILIPGGYLQEGELPSQAAKRELFEETGVTAEPQDSTITPNHFSSSMTDLRHIP